MTEKNNQHTNQHPYLPAIIGLTLSAGILLGLFISNYKVPVGDIHKSAGKYAQILKLIHTDYVDSVNTDAIIDHSITKMLEKLDPHTSYIPVSDVSLVSSQLEGGFEGIGIEFQMIKDTLTVLATIRSGPSEKAGIMPGDKIISVDGQLISGIGADNKKIFNTLRGKKGTTVTIEVKRRTFDILLPFDIVRDKIPTYSVDATYMLTKEIGYIKISRFAENTYKEFLAALKKLQGEGMKSLVLDLRDNGGGYMQMAIQIIDEFLPEERLIVYTDGKGSKYDESHKATKKGEFLQGAVVVLINENSASASEIVSGALQDNDRALLIGRRTYGKGLVQKPIRLLDGSEIRLTISRYYTPSGRSIQKPYTSLDEYANDYHKRLARGEFYNADSVFINDSLRYKTIGGRSVFGGGGIIPDIFIPQDTTMYTDYLGRLYASNVLREYAVEYAGEHKKALESNGLSNFAEHFYVSETMLSELIKLAAKSGINYNSKQYRKSKEQIKQDVKAMIARSLWSDLGYYTVVNKSDDFVLKAINSMKLAEKIASGQL